jgi:hypothetical protein
MERKECFGILKRVFPANDSGYREVLPQCLQCPERVSCLKAALKTREGIEMRARVLERAPVRGIMGKIRRWSLKKELSRMAGQEADRDHDS